MLRDSRNFRSISADAARRHSWSRRNVGCGMPEVCGFVGLATSYSCAALDNQPKQGLLAGLNTSDRFEIKV
ncbi:MAG TPA: hypothetical protein VF596_08065 [Pyrinomonadaceae bacterium]|jgi:hypothetical protein